MVVGEHAPGSDAVANRATRAPQRRATVLSLDEERILCGAMYVGITANSDFIAAADAIARRAVGAAARDTNFVTGITPYT